MFEKFKIRRKKVITFDEWDYCLHSLKMESLLKRDKCAHIVFCCSTAKRFPLKYFKCCRCYKIDHANKLLIFQGRHRMYKCPHRNYEKGIY